MTMTDIESVLLVNGTNAVTISSKRAAAETISPAMSKAFQRRHHHHRGVSNSFVGYTYENFLIETNGGNDIVTGAPATIRSTAGPTPMPWPVGPATTL